MKTKIANHFRQNVVGYIALFVALSGSAYAAASLPKDSVGTEQLKRGAVTTPKIKNGAVTRPKLGNAAVAAFKVRCPHGTLRAVGSCVETGHRQAASWTSAMLVCQLAGRRLPTPGELVAFGKSYGMSDLEWVDGEYSVQGQGDLGSLYRGTRGGGMAFGFGTNVDEDHPFRCATGPSN